MLIRSNTHHDGEMSAQEETAWLHFLSGDPLFRDFVRSQGMFGNDIRRVVARQPMCPKCERPGFYHGKGMACNHCGYTGATTIKSIEYVRGGHYK